MMEVPPPLAKDDIQCLEDGRWFAEFTYQGDSIRAAADPGAIDRYLDTKAAAPVWLTYLSQSGCMLHGRLSSLYYYWRDFMGLKTARLTIDRSLLPQRRNDLGVRFERQSIAKIKASSPPADMMLIRPAGSLLSEEDAVGPEPRARYILCGMELKAHNGTAAQGSGLLVITAQRFIGMIETGW